MRPLAESMMFFRRCLLAGLCLSLASFCDPSVVLALAGILNSPSISISVQPNGDPDPLGSAVQAVLRKHEKAFVTGMFVNAHSTMQFRGKAEQLNRFLHDLSEVEGAEISIRFGKPKKIDADVAAEDAHNHPFRWSLEHNGWGNPASLSVTIAIGDGEIDLGEIDLPKIRGRAAAEAAPVKKETIPE